MTFGSVVRGFLAALVAAAGLAVAAPSAPAAAGDCSGVLVVVDFRPFGGDITRGCASTPTTGRAALESVTIDIVEVQRQPGFVCRIAGKPADDRCVNTPPASAYWSYWHADAGRSSWSYSSRGASSSQPKAGSIDAWVFGATDIGGTTGGPCFSPADARAGRATSCVTAPKPHRTTKAPKTAHRSPATSRTTDGPARPASSNAGASSTATSAATSARPTASTSAPAPTPSASTGSVSAPAIVDATPAAGERAKDGGGSALPVVLGLILALAIGGAAAWTVRRRRAAADGS